MRILVTNDDGIYSPGLWALAEAASQFGEVFVAAPDTEQSAAGHAITIAHPVRAYPHPSPSTPPTSPPTGCGGPRRTAWPWASTSSAPWTWSSRG